MTRHIWELLVEGGLLDIEPSPPPLSSYREEDNDAWVKDIGRSPTIIPLRLALIEYQNLAQNGQHLSRTLEPKIAPYLGVCSAVPVKQSLAPKGRPTACLPGRLWKI